MKHTAKRTCHQCGSDRRSSLDGNLPLEDRHTCETCGKPTCIDCLDSDHDCGTCSQR